ncbi:hypothetical protein ElyMa_004989700 [Elysia marginata]|uniref:Uncharacterized protein n=1 Tax=Elysia marginata TaxID=1093978 RepID=A0AAV4J7T1_9GAST|nr:hypothetical protein ElyMa_004989700 [Elysia marginata]
MATLKALGSATLKEEGELSEDDDDAHTHKQLQYFRHQTGRPQKNYISMKKVHDNINKLYSHDGLTKSRSTTVRYESKRSKRNEVSRSKRRDGEEVRDASLSGNSGSVDSEGKRYRESNTRSHTQSPQHHGSSNCILSYQINFKQHALKRGTLISLRSNLTF